MATNHESSVQPIGELVELRQRVAELESLLGEKQQAGEVAQQLGAEMAVVDRVCNIVTSTLDIKQVYEQFALELRKLVAFDRAHINLVNEGADTFTIAYLFGQDVSNRHIGTVRQLSGSLTGDVVSAGRTVIQANIASAQDEYPGDPEYTQAGLSSGITVPLIAKTHVIGTLGLISRQLDAFGSREQSILERLANQIAPAVDNAGLYDALRAEHDQSQALAQRLVESEEVERRRIALELHDEIGQLLTGVKLTLERSTRAPTASIGTHLIGEAQNLVDELMARVRNLSMELRPTILDDLGLMPTMVWYIRRYTEQTNIRVTFQPIALDRRLPSIIETAAYRISQEALTNVARHAGVDQAKVKLEFNGGRLLVQIEDGGLGFSPNEVSVFNSTGLSGMRERAQLLGGKLILESAPGQGTRLTAELPLTIKK